MQVTLYDFLQEMKSFTKVDSRAIEEASKSDITTKNSKTLNRLLRSWTRGDYDEDPDLLVQELEWLSLN